MSAAAQTLPEDPAELQRLVRMLQAQLAENPAGKIRDDGFQIGRGGQMESLPDDDEDDLRQQAFANEIDTLRDELERTKGERDEALQKLKAAKAGLMLKILELEKIKAEIAKLRRMKFGQSSERFDAQLAQLELSLEDMEADLSEDIAGDSAAIAVVEAERAKREKRIAKRQKIPPNFPRETISIPAPDSDNCGECGGSMGLLGTDITEVLDFVPAQWIVKSYERPKFACKACDHISQAPAPGLPVPRGKAGAGLLAHVAISKYCDHLPLYRQAEIYARQGLDLSRSTMSDWIGHCAWLLQPLADLIARHVFAGAKIHTDDTPVQTLVPGRGKTKQGRLWVYVRHDRNWQPTGTANDPPAAIYYYSPDRKGERPRSHLANFSGFLQADGYAGYDQLYRDGTTAGEIVEVACWAHARRKIYDVWKQRQSPTAAAGLAIVKNIYALEAELRGQPVHVRTAGRIAVRHEVERFFEWADQVLRGLSNHDSLAQAIRYAVARRRALSVFLDDGRLEADNNRAENSLRRVALGRKNWMFAGSDKGGDRAALFYTLFETAKLNDIDPFAWLRDVLTRIGEGHPVNRLEELLPWNWSDSLARPIPVASVEDDHA